MRLSPIGIEQSRRRIYRRWHEGIVPQLVIETTSKATRARDTNEKPDLFAKLGIREYFLHDPTGEYLEPPLQGYRVIDGAYQQIVADSDGGQFFATRFARSTWISRLVQRRAGIPARLDFWTRDGYLRA
jgi:hypothetical protein